MPRSVRLSWPGHDGVDGAVQVRRQHADAAVRRVERRRRRVGRRLGQRAERDDLLADRQRARVEDAPGEPVFSTFVFAPTLTSTVRWSAHDVIAAHRERALDGELIAAARDDVAVDGVERARR